MSDSMWQDVRVELDEPAIRRWYDEYVADVAYYREHDELDADHPDPGYRTGVAPPFEEYAQDVLSGVVEDVVGAHPGYRVVKRDG